MDDHPAAFWVQVSTEIGVPIEALVFIYDALKYAPQYHGDEPGDIEFEGRHCTVQEFCRGFIEYAKDTFGSEYGAALKLWGLDTSEKLGRVIYDLIGRDLLLQQDGDQPSDFNGRFDLSRGLEAE